MEFKNFFLNKDNSFNEYYDKYKEYELNLLINDNFLKISPKFHYAILR